MNSPAEILNQAFRHHQAGNLPQAEQCYRRLLDQNPRHVDALHMLGLVGLQTGRLDMARELIGKAVQLKPDFAEAHSNLGNVLQQSGQLEQAIASWRRALRFKPQIAEVHCNLGLALLEQKHLDEAEASLRQALRLRPDYPDAHSNLGNVLKERGKPAEAIACYQQALRIRPDFAQAYVNLGVVLHEQGQPEEAVACYQQALRCDPHHREVAGNLGLALKDLGRLDEALANLQRAVQLAPANPDAHVNLGVVLQQLGRLAEAAGCYQQALRVKPDDAKAHYNLGMTLLHLGHWQQGWAEYEWRWQTEGFNPPEFPHPLWDGSPLAGRTLLLITEQGLGDTLQFIRFAPLAKSLPENRLGLVPFAVPGAQKVPDALSAGDSRPGSEQLCGKVLVNCQGALVRLLAGCAGIDRLIPQGQPLPPFDVYAPLMSLPRLLGISLAAVSTGASYLSADLQLIESWRQRLPGPETFKVGIAWQGNPTYREDRRRSFPLLRFAPLAALAGVQLFSLQKGHGIEQVQAAADRVSVTVLGENLDEAAGTFMDTAAIMKNLDLVVTSDTSIAHLAGGLGVPVWVAIPFACDWRWLEEREDCPWYPTMRLFRQPAPGNWEAVFERMAATLRQVLTHRQLSGAQQT